MNNEPNKAEVDFDNAYSTLLTKKLAGRIDRALGEFLEDNENQVSSGVVLSGLMTVTMITLMETAHLNKVPLEKVGADYINGLQEAIRRAKRHQEVGE